MCDTAIAALVSFRAAGGRGELVWCCRSRTSWGHGVFASPRGTPFWIAAISRFFNSSAIAMPL